MFRVARLCAVLFTVAGTGCGGGTLTDLLPGDPSGDGDNAAGDTVLFTGADSDGDLLPDAWETSAGDLTILDPNRADTDNDGTSDADEDPDGDGLTNIEELAVSRMTTAPPGGQPHPLRHDLLVELDAMSGKALTDAVLSVAVTAYAAAAITNIARGGGS